MANSNEAHTKASSKSVPKKPATDTSKTTKQDKSSAEVSATIDSSKRVLTIVAILAVIIIAGVALICGLYATYTNLKLHQTASQQTLEIDALKQQQLDNKTSNTAITHTLNQMQTKLQQRMQKLEKNVQTAMQQRLYQKQDWLLLKARYYLELAQINAHWSEDQQATIALLQQADALLITFGDQESFTVRQAIAREIAQLQALPKIDIAGLLSQLDAAQSIISDLSIKQPYNQTKDTTSKASESKVTTWREQLRESINLLGKLVVVRRYDNNIQPLLSPMHQAMLRESIRMNLQEAQWAILQNNPAVYQLALTQAIKNIKRSFEENTSTQSLIKQLQRLQQEKLATSKPVIEESLPLLNQLIESKNSQIDTSTNKEGDHSL